MSSKRRSVSDFCEVGKWYQWGSLESVRDRSAGWAGVGQCVRVTKTRAHFTGTEAWKGSEWLSSDPGWRLAGPDFDIGTIADARDAREVSAEEGVATLAAWREEYAAHLARERAERDAAIAAEAERRERRAAADEVVKLFEAAVIEMPIEEIRALRERLARAAVEAAAPREETR